jgi:hypothetical protein
MSIIKANGGGGAERPQNVIVKNPVWCVLKDESGTALGTQTNPIYVDGVSGGTVPLPTGAATEATLATLNGKVTACNTGAVVVASSALPTGASTAALQTSGNASLTTIAGKDFATQTTLAAIKDTDGIKKITDPVAVTTVKPDGTNTMPSLDNAARAGYVYVTDGTTTQKIDATTGCSKHVSFEHSHIHDGRHFYIQEVVDLAANAVREIRITTPNTAEWAHFTFKLSCESETEVYLYEDVTIVTAGTPVTPVNNNRNSATTSGLTVDYIDNASVANANADTTVSGYIHHAIAGANKDQGQSERDRELILLQNKTYSLRMIATVAGFVNYEAEFYEHTNL